MTERAFHIAGWVLFIFSAFGFVASSAASGDAAGLTGAVLFLIACFVFLVPLVRRREPKGTG